MRPITLTFMQCFGSGSGCFDQVGSGSGWIPDPVKVTRIRNTELNHYHFILSIFTSSHIIINNNLLHQTIAVLSVPFIHTHIIIQNLKSKINSSVTISVIQISLYHIHCKIKLVCLAYQLNNVHAQHVFVVTIIAYLAYHHLIIHKSQNQYLCCRFHSFSKHCLFNNSLHQ